MADAQILQRCKHKKGACKLCDSGICSCVKPKGRHRNILRDIEPIRVNVTRNARPSLEFLSLEDEIPDYEFVESVIDDRRKAKFRTDLNATAFHPIQRVFRAMTAGILKMLLPAWHVPELKKWIKIPDGADREDSDDSDGDGENALPAFECI
ncbi:hypothetical protein EMCRGX_G023334 [Ephydatia muelleri]